MARFGAGRPRALKLLLTVLLALGATALLQAARSHWPVEPAPWFRSLAWPGAPDDLRWSTPIRASLDFALDGWRPIARTRLPADEALPRYLHVTLEQLRSNPDDEATPSRRLQQLLDRYRARKHGLAPADEPATPAPTVALHVQRLGSAQRALILLRKRHPGTPLQKLEGLASLAGRDPETGRNWVEFLAGRYLIVCQGDRLPDEGLVDVASRFLESNRETLLGAGTPAPARARKTSARRQHETHGQGRTRHGDGSMARRVTGTKTPRGGAAPTPLPGPEPGPGPGNEKRNRGLSDTSVDSRLSAEAGASPVSGTPERQVEVLPSSHQQRPHSTTAPAPIPPAVSRMPAAPAAPRAAPGKQNVAARAQYEMGRQFVAMERPEEALRAFAASLALDPSFGEVRGLIAEVEQRFGATPEALGLEIPAATAHTEAPEAAPATTSEGPVETATEPPALPPARPTTASKETTPPIETAPVAAPAVVTPALTSTRPAVAPSAMVTSPAAAGSPGCSPSAPRGRHIPLLPLLMAGVFSCLMFFLLKRRLGA